MDKHFFKVSGEQLSKLIQKERDLHFSGKQQIAKPFLVCEICGATEETEICSRTITIY